MCPFSTRPLKIITINRFSLYLTKNEKSWRENTYLRLNKYPCTNNTLHYKTSAN